MPTFSKSCLVYTKYILFFNFSYNTLYIFYQHSIWDTIIYLLYIFYFGLSLLFFPFMLLSNILLGTLPFCIFLIQHRSHLYCCPFSSPIMCGSLYSSIFFFPTSAIYFPYLSQRHPLNYNFHFKPF